MAASENVSKCAAQGKHTRYHVSDVACRQELLHFSCYVLGVVLVAFVEKVLVDHGFALIPCDIPHQHESARTHTKHPARSSTLRTTTDVV